ncbi:hypothetical protein QOZ80_5AG0368540 [Eleusine coracana subsp. coracana]|nr:hypothetical protein QOZ80_5AG0368540 [Eleusine coracana subsp. coracana]
MHRLLSLLLLLLCSSYLLSAVTNAEDVSYFHIECVSDTNYTRGGAFQSNLESLLSSLPSSAAASGGFAENATGAAPDEAYGLAQCRRDASARDCSKCVDTLAQKLSSGCQGLKSAIAVASPCMLRYSNVSFFGKADTSYLIYYNAPLNATEPDLFMTRLDGLMSNLTRKAAHGNPRMFAAGAVDHTPLVKIYGMAQCTGDLGGDDCYSCLDRAAAYIPTYWGRKQGGQAILWSCFVRFESAIFYNVHAAEIAMSSSPALAPVPAPGDGSPNYSNHSSQGSTDAATGAGMSQTVRTALLASVPVTVTMLVLMFVAVLTCKKNRKPYRHVRVASNRLGDEETGSLEPFQYDLSTLRAATDNFSEQNKLGQGGFGPVYKGILQNGKNIAVKRLSATSEQGQAEMKNEIVLVAKLQHKNLVRLLGFCMEQDENLLVYEFLSNKSLNKILYGPTRQELSWAQRYKIIKGIGRGLLYLHEDSRLKIVHRDLKPGNILLDVDMNPKIADFGLAKLFHIDSSVKNTIHQAGTYGYMAPEYILNGIFSAKSDVFSFGVLVLEVITGRRPSEDLLKFVWRHWRQGNVTPLLESCQANEHEQQEMLRCIHIGLLCIQDDPELRPPMGDVGLMLNSPSMALDAPTEPIFATTSERPKVVAPELSISKASISDLEPR